MLCVVRVSLYLPTHRVNTWSQTYHAHMHAEVRDDINQTPLHRACWRGRTKVVKFLVEEANCNTGELIIL